MIKYYTIFKKAVAFRSIKHEFYLKGGLKINLIQEKNV